MSDYNVPLVNWARLTNEQVPVDTSPFKAPSLLDQLLQLSQVSQNNASGQASVMQAQDNRAKTQMEMDQDRDFQSAIRDYATKKATRMGGQPPAGSQPSGPAPITNPPAQPAFPGLGMARMTNNMAGQMPGFGALLVGNQAPNTVPMGQPQASQSQGYDPLDDLHNDIADRQGLLDAMLNHARFKNSPMVTQLMSEQNQAKMKLAEARMQQQARNGSQDQSRARMIQEFVMGEVKQGRIPNEEAIQAMLQNTGGAITPEGLTESARGNAAPWSPQTIGGSQFLTKPGQRPVPLQPGPVEVHQANRLFDAQNPLPPTPEKPEKDKWTAVPVTNKATGETAMGTQMVTSDGQIVQKGPDGMVISNGSAQSAPAAVEDVQPQTPGNPNSPWVVATPKQDAVDFRVASTVDKMAEAFKTKDPGASIAKAATGALAILRPSILNVADQKKKDPNNVAYADYDSAILHAKGAMLSPGQAQRTAFLKQMSGSNSWLGAIAGSLGRITEPSSLNKDTREDYSRGIANGILLDLMQGADSETKKSAELLRMSGGKYDPKMSDIRDQLQTAADEGWMKMYANPQLLQRAKDILAGKNILKGQAPADTAKIRRMF